MSSKKIIVLSGSIRTQSINTAIARLTAAELTAQGANAEFIDLADYDAPLYNGDLEAASGLPATMLKLRRKVMDADALVVASPEYNGHLTPLLINVFAWISRALEEGERPSAVFKGKIGAVMSASPGRGLRVIPRIRDYLTDVGTIVIDGHFNLQRAKAALNDDGSLYDPSKAQELKEFMSKLIKELG